MAMSHSPIVPQRIILLSGHVCSGKTTLARLLSDRFEANHLKTSECIIARHPSVKRDRGSMQLAGEQLDEETGGRWVLDAFRKCIEGNDDANSVATVVLDSVRISGQIDAIRQGFPNRVTHIHLDAPKEELERRYKDRVPEGIKEFSSYDEVLANPTEQKVGMLAKIADVVISSSRSTQEDVLLRAASHAGLFGRDFDRVVDVIIGGQYGSEGKGQIAAYLAPEYDLLVRVGGPNAGHTVWQDPEPYTFHHLPSGTLSNPDAHLVIAAGAVIRPTTLLKEIADCQIESDRLTIDPQAMLITDEDVSDENVLRNAIGSTAQGVGSATARRITDRKKARVECTIAENCSELKPFIRSTLDVLDAHFRNKSPIMLEGTQGTGLSLYHGGYPHVTSRDTTVAGCLADAGISPSRVRKVVMVCRTYPIRVESPGGSSSGNLSRELTWKEVSGRSGVSVRELEKAERTSTTDRPRRVGEFDWALLRRSASLNAPTDIALTFADYLSKKNRDAFRMEQLTKETNEFINEVERVATTPVSLVSVRFHSRGVIDRRRW